MLARVALMMSSSAGWNVEDKGWSFFWRNFLLRLAFLLLAEGLFLLAAMEATGADFSRGLVAMEKLKVEPMEREKVKDWPWLASVWQRAKHWEAKETFSSPTAVIFFSLLN